MRRLIFMLLAVWSLVFSTTTISSARTADLTVRRSSNHPTLRSGSRGPDVRVLQDMLNTWYGSKYIVVDGIFGRQTYDLVKWFQFRNNLVDDGIVGQQTWSKLEAVQ